MKTVYNTFKISIFSVVTALLLLASGGVSADDLVSQSAGAKQWRSPFFSPVVGNMYFLGGAGFYNMDGLNDSLDDAGYSTLKSPSLSLGLGFDISIGRLIVGSEWQWLKNVGTEAERDDLRADIKSQYWLFRLGVDLVHWRGLRVYPLLGIGTASTKVSISSEMGASFDDVLADPGREVRMAQTGLLLDASLGIDYRFKIRETERKSSFFTVGVRGGYLFAPYSSEWRTGSAEISGGPDLLMSGPTAQLVIGFSGEHKRCRRSGCGHAANPNQNHP